MTIRRWLPKGFQLVLLVLYVGSYLVLSRRAFQVADATNAEGFYFVEPSSDAAWLVHEACCVFYYPLILLDQLLGTGRPPASRPLGGLSLDRPTCIEVEQPASAPPLRG